ncbi:MAG: hypothetical protein O2807_03130 [bacterium]|nr:hypothetical protein [bacterium]
MTSPVLERMRALCALPGPPGREDAVRGALVEMLRGEADVLREDGFGNLIAQKNLYDGVPHVLVECHMDEVGVVVTGVEPGGAIRFDKVGLVANAVFPGREVELLAEDGTLIRGVVNIRSGHLQALQGQEHPTPAQMWIDLGNMDGAAVRLLGIGPGTPGVFCGSFEPLGGGAWKSKAVDNRSGCALAVEAVLRAGELGNRLKLSAAFCAQEEIGARGASVLSVTATCGGKPPDFAVVIDTVQAEGPEGVADAMGVRLGAGPVLRRYDHERGIPESLHGHIPPHELVTWVKEAAKEAGVPLQEDAVIGTFTDASTLSRSVPGGMPVVNLNLPRRYSHSPVEIFLESDLDQMAALLGALLGAAAEGNIPQKQKDYLK